MLRRLIGFYQWYWLCKLRVWWLWCCEGRMSIYQVFIINRAGSLIYDWEDSKEGNVGIEKTFSYPLDIIFDIVDQKISVVFGERDSIAIRFVFFSLIIRFLTFRLGGQRWWEVIWIFLLEYWIFQLFGWRRNVKCEGEMWRTGKSFAVEETDGEQVVRQMYRLSELQLQMRWSANVAESHDRFYAIE